LRTLTLDNLVLARRLNPVQSRIAAAGEPQSQDSSLAAVRAGPGPVRATVI
jgi:hypothetical protein